MNSVSTAANALGDFTGQTDVGALHHAGACTYDPVQQIYTISGAGANIWGDRDDFHYVWRRHARQLHRDGAGQLRR